MKRYFLGCLSLVMASGISFSAFADDLATPSAGPAATSTSHARPCKTIAEACKAAGFVRGKSAPAGKDLFHDCLKPIMHGQSVAGVTVDPADVQACNAKIAARHKG